ncbi:S-layer homology domain-containing protein, partial [Dysosmobacter sp.]|uniref:S-layer homology domain-containing protein n=1 Tax=Dysosmobacter sp. TaxID=2591382 RepID=UPI003AB3E6D3
MKKFLSLVLALVMTMSLVTVSAGAKDFTDNDKITYDEAVAVMSAAKVIDGYAEGDFRPTNTLTRGAAAKIICNLILGPTTASALVADAAPYKDVPTNSTFAGYIAYCQKEGIISGYADGTFKPGNTLTGYAFMKMLLGALGYDSAIEGYTGANWSIAVAKQAINAGLNNSLKGSFNGVKAVTREEACLYAFNTLKATMVEYDNRIVVGEGSTAVAVSGVRKDLTWNKGTLNDGKIKKDGYVQFGEQYFEKLTRTDDTDDFGRPASKWTYDKKDVGTYVNYDLLVSEYTTKVKGGDVYSDIGSVAADYDLTYYVDGVKLEKDAVKAQSSYIAKKNDDKMGDSGNGVLTQIFVDNDDEALTIVEINTYLAKTDDYNEKKETLKFNEIYGYGDVKLTKKLVKAVEAVELDDIASIKDYKDGDMVLLTIANGEVKTITPAETVKGTEIDEFSKQDYDKDGYAVDVDKLKEGIDNDYILLSDYMDQKPDDLNIITNKGQFSSQKVQVEKDTLWITDQTAKRGFALADKCPAVIVELNKDSKGNWEIDDT